jgi:hypothetical protein
MSALSSAIHNTGHCHGRPRPVCLSRSCAQSANNGRSRRSSCDLASLDLRRRVPKIGSVLSAESAASGADCVFRSGAPRSMKMGTTPSPWRYDAAACHALQSVALRRPAILRYDPWAASGFWRVARYAPIAGHANRSRDRREGPQPGSALFIFALPESLRLRGRSR